MDAERAAIPATPEQAKAVGQAIARGFQDNEIWEWITPNPAWRARLLSRHYPIMIRHIYGPAGTAWTTPGAVGGALWHPPGGLSSGALRKLHELRSLVPWIGPGGISRGGAFEALIEHHHPTEPHWYLETLSIDPKHQRRGYGSALIAPVLERCDAEGLPAYLETQRRANIPFYRRFGFEVTDEVTTRDSPPLWLMWREAPR